MAGEDADRATTTSREWLTWKPPGVNRGQRPAAVKECLGEGSRIVENGRVPDRPQPTRTFQIHAVQGWRRLVLWPLGLLVRLWGISLRIDTTASSRRALEKHDEPVAAVMWHNRLFFSAEYFRRFRRGKPLYALVSASADGAWLTAFFSLVGIRTVRGSSSQGGREAALTLIELLRSGQDVGITPDGPRGPMYDFKPGGLIVTRRALAPMVLMGFTLESAWRLNSWDRFYLPKPFSRVKLQAELVPVQDQAHRDEAVQRLQARMLALNPDHPTDRPVVI